MVRPFQVLLHAPGQAEHLARLGHVVRFESGLDGADRELAILATGRAHGCRLRLGHPSWTWRAAKGTSPGGYRITSTGDARGPGAQERPPSWTWWNELCSSSSLSASTFARVESELGAEATVELSVLVGYYTLLGYAMASFDVCASRAPRVDQGSEHRPPVLASGTVPDHTVER